MTIRQAAGPGADRTAEAPGEVPAPAPAGAPAVAFLVSAYPALSHAFIEREVLALRALGVRVETFTVRAPDADARLSEASRAEAARTTALLGQPATAYLGAVGELARARPAALLAGVRAAWSNGPRTVRSRVWQHFYLVEAVFLLQRLRTAGVRHLHVHFANNGADVARLVVALGEALEGRGAGWRWTFSMHGPTEFLDPAAHDLPAKVRSASAVACISEYARDLLCDLAGQDQRGKTAIVRMGVETSRFPPAGRERAERAGGPLRVLFVGRLVPEKGPDVLLDAVRSLRRRGRDLDVVVVGAGPLLEGLRERVAREDLGAVVRLLGPVGQDDLPQWYRWADVFCLPSFAEGVPVVLMEAMATELPVVTTRIAGIPELVVDGETGVLVEPGDAEAVADAVDRLAADPATRHALGRRARSRVEEEFRPGPNAQRLLDLFAARAGVRP